MVTTSLVRNLKEKITMVMKMSMFQQAAKAPLIVVDSVKVIESLNNDVVNIGERLKHLETEQREMSETLLSHIKTGR